MNLQITSSESKRTQHFYSTSATQSMLAAHVPARLRIVGFDYFSPKRTESLVDLTARAFADVLSTPLPPEYLALQSEWIGDEEIETVKHMWDKQWQAFCLMNPESLPAT